jgi:hypothetical protein
MQRATMNKLSRLADVSTKLLAVVGGASLVYAVVTFPGRVFDGLPEPEVFVTPYCVALLNSDHEYEDGSKAYMELRGFRIDTTADISNIRFRIDGQNYIAAWHVSSNGIATDELADLVAKQLPRGAQKRAPLFGDIPRLMANTDVEVQFSAVKDPTFDCSSDWFTVSVPGKKVFHRMWPKVYHIRELSFESPWVNTYKWLFFGLLLLNIGYLLLRNMRTVSKE